MSPEANVKLVLKYFDGCNTGDIEHLKSTLEDDVVHYFLPQVHRPIRGSDHLARYWRKFKQVYQPTWKIDHTLASGNEVVSEWSCAYTQPSTGDRLSSLGASIGVTTAGAGYLSVGYNIEGFAEEDFSQGGHTDQGAFIQFRMRLDQDSLKGIFR